jgi:competence protein ComEA
MAVRSSPLSALGVVVALLGIATLGHAPPTREPATLPAARPRVRHRVDINRASAAELESLPRVGPALAARIVAHREAHGPFGSIEALDAVPGVGPATLEALRSHVTLSVPDGHAPGLPHERPPR